jgi:hypothetical protein
MKKTTAARFWSAVILGMASIHALGCGGQVDDTLPFLIERTGRDRDHEIVKAKAELAKAATALLSTFDRFQWDLEDYRRKLGAWQKCYFPDGESLLAFRPASPDYVEHRQRLQLASGRFQQAKSLYEFEVKQSDERFWSENRNQLMLESGRPERLPRPATEFDATIDAAERLDREWKHRFSEVSQWSVSS